MDVEEGLVRRGVSGEVRRWRTACASKSAGARLDTVVVDGKQRRWRRRWRQMRCPGAWLSNSHTLTLTGDASLNLPAGLGALGASAHACGGVEVEPARGIINTRQLEILTPEFCLWARLWRRRRCSSGLHCTAARFLHCLTIRCGKRSCQKDD